MIDWLNAPDGRFGADAAAGRDEVPAAKPDQAVAELTKSSAAASRVAVGRRSIITR